MSKKRIVKLTAIEREQNIEDCRRNLPPGTIIYTVCEEFKNAYSWIRPFSISIEKNKWDTKPTPYVFHWAWEAIALAGMDGDDDHSGVKVYGTGLCRHYEVVHALGEAIYPDGFGDEGVLPNGKKRRPKSQADAARMKARGYVFYGRNGNDSGWDNCGGYAFIHRKL